MSLVFTSSPLALCSDSELSPSFLSPMDFPFFLMNLASSLEEFQLFFNLVCWGVFSLICYCPGMEENKGFSDSRKVLIVHEDRGSKKQSCMPRLSPECVFSLGHCDFIKVLTSRCTCILGHHLEDTVSEASPEFQRPPRVSTSCPWKENCCSFFSPFFVPSLTPAQEEDPGAVTAAVTMCGCTS